jgi:hypothetical protein
MSVMKKIDMNIFGKFVIGTMCLISFTWGILILSDDSIFVYKELKDNSKHQFPHLMEDEYVVDANNNPITHLTIVGYVLLSLGGLNKYYYYFIYRCISIYCCDNYFLITKN